MNKKDFRYIFTYRKKVNDNYFDKTPNLKNYINANANTVNIYSYIYANNNCFNYDFYDCIIDEPIDRNYLIISYVEKISNSKINCFYFYLYIHNINLYLHKERINNFIILK